MTHETSAETMTRLLEERVQTLAEHEANGTQPSEEQARYFYHLIQFNNKLQGITE